MRKKALLFVTLVTLAGGCKSTEPMKEQPKQEMIEEVRVPDRIHFNFDNYELTSDAKKVLKLQVEWLEQNENIKILIEGHCDERGSKEYNLYLGKKRANATKDYLVKKGIASRRIKTVSYGKDRPEYLGNSESVWSKNRRAVIIEKN